ncbi:MAG: F0F1 ATP synthase subunit A [Verrucomicrobiota bacterium]
MLNGARKDRPPLRIAPGGSLLTPPLMDATPLMMSLNSLGPLIAAGGLNAPELPSLAWITNSIFVALVVTVGVLLFTRMATKNMKLIPDAKQNFVELVIEFLYNQVEAIVGKHVAPKAFPLLATIFIFVIVANWFGLVPGVGTIGWGETKAALSIEKMETPLLRPATADLNMTLALAVVFMVVWLWVSVAELGLIGSLLHIFGPKGGLRGFLMWALMPIFIFVGLIEVVSIVFRPMSLSLRLFGNVYAGETLLATMQGLGEQLGFPGWLSWISSFVFPLPFYFLEILVGAVQATVFALLCAVYIKLSTSHEEH